MAYALVAPQKVLVFQDVASQSRLLASCNLTGSHWVEHALCHLLDKTSKTRSGTWQSGILLAVPSCVKGLKYSRCSQVIVEAASLNTVAISNGSAIDLFIFFHSCNSYPCCLSKTAPSALVNCRLWARDTHEKGFLPFVKCQKVCWTRNTHTALDAPQFEPPMKTTKLKRLIAARWSISKFPTTMECLGLSRLSADCGSMYIPMTIWAHYRSIQVQILK